MIDDNSREFIRRHIGPSEEDIEKMLKVVGANSLDDLINKTVPENILLKDRLKIDDPTSEHESMKQVKAISEKNILVVTPYNAQDLHLRTILPDDSKIGTVDKFQGQEEQITLISMVTSTSEDIPRNMEFLYSRNRLNVALSRSKCLSVIVLNPNLLDAPCRTIEQMELVNTFCWLKAYSDSLLSGKGQ